MDFVWIAAVLALWAAMVGLAHALCALQTPRGERP
jgi:hypothetical protein